MNGEVDTTNLGMQDVDGADVLDASGDKIGAVDRTYDDDEGRARLVEVKIGSLFAKHRLVPLDRAKTADNGIQVPYGRDTIEGSPDAHSVGDTLEGSFLDSVWAYYSGENADTDADNPVNVPGAVPIGDATSESPKGVPEPALSTETAPAATTQASGEDAPNGMRLGEVRDMGDVIEVPVIEEELVKRPVVKEVLRIRKTQVVEPRTIEADVRKEDVEVVKDGDAVVRDDTGEAR